MTKEELKDKIEDIQNNNIMIFKGSCHESDLKTCEEISDLFLTENAALIERCKELEESLTEILKHYEFNLNKTQKANLYLNEVYNKANNLLTKHK